MFQLKVDGNRNMREGSRDRGREDRGEEGSRERGRPRQNPEAHCHALF